MCWERSAETAIGAPSSAQTLCCEPSGTEEDQANSDLVPHPVSPPELGSAGEYSARCPQSQWTSAAFVIFSSNCWENRAQQSLEADQFNRRNAVPKVVNPTGPDWFLHPWQPIVQKSPVMENWQKLLLFIFNITDLQFGLIFFFSVTNKALFSLSCDKMVFA